LHRGDRRSSHALAVGAARAHVQRPGCERPRTLAALAAAAELGVAAARLDERRAPQSPCRGAALATVGLDGAPGFAASLDLFGGKRSPVSPQRAGGSRSSV